MHTRRGARTFRTFILLQRLAYSAIKSINTSVIVVLFGYVVRVRSPLTALNVAHYVWSFC